MDADRVTASRLTQRGMRFTHNNLFILREIQASEQVETFTANLVDVTILFPFAIFPEAKGH